MLHPSLTRSRNVFCFVRGNNGQLAYIHQLPIKTDEADTFYSPLITRQAEHFVKASTRTKSLKFPLLQISKPVLHHNGRRRSSPSLQIQHQDELHRMLWCHRTRSQKNRRLVCSILALSSAVPLRMRQRRCSMSLTRICRHHVLRRFTRRSNSRCLR